MRFHTISVLLLLSLTANANAVTPECAATVSPYRVFLDEPGPPVEAVEFEQLKKMIGKSSSTNLPGLDATWTPDFPFWASISVEQERLIRLTSAQRDDLREKVVETYGAL